MLLESDVIDAVCMKLESIGYTIDQRLMTNQHGDDIVAVKSGSRPRKLLIEAKGETSSRQNSERYGRPFNRAQVRVHVAEAFYKAAQVLSRETKEDIEIISAIALPDSKLHHEILDKIQPIVNQLGIAVFWVQINKTVEISSLFQL